MNSVWQLCWHCWYTCTAIWSGFHKYWAATETLLYFFWHSKPAMSVPPWCCLDPSGGPEKSSWTWRWSRSTTWSTSEGARSSGSQYMSQRTPSKGPYCVCLTSLLSLNTHNSTLFPQLQSVTLPGPGPTLHIWQLSLSIWYTNLKIFSQLPLCSMCECMSEYVSVSAGDAPVSQQLDTVLHGCLLKSTSSSMLKDIYA